MFITQCSKKIFIIKTFHNEFKTNNTFNPGRGLQGACVLTKTATFLKLKDYLKQIARE